MRTLNLFSRFIILFSVCFFFLISCDTKDKKLRSALELAGDNKEELLKVIDHYQKDPGDSLKLRAARFLAENMPGHFSYDYNKEKYPLAIQRLVDSLLFRYSDFANTYGIISDYPFLRMTDFSIAKRGVCSTKCWFNSMLFASLGIPVAIDFVPNWGNRNDRHRWNTLLYNDKIYPFEPFWEEDKWKYKKLYNNQSSDSSWGDFRLAKVYRYSYRTNTEGPVGDPDESYCNIPPLFLDIKKKDVSSEYFETTDIDVVLENNPPLKSHYAYLCIFSFHNLVPVQWGKISQGKVV